MVGENPDASAITLDQQTQQLSRQAYKGLRTDRTYPKRIRRLTVKAAGSCICMNIAPINGLGCI
jgi:hypothetical protein